MASGLVPGTPVDQLFSPSSQPSTPTLQDIQDANLGGVSSGHAMSQLQPESSQNLKSLCLCIHICTLDEQAQRELCSREVSADFVLLSLPQFPKSTASPRKMFPSAFFGCSTLVCVAASGCQHFYADQPRLVS